MCTSHLTEKLSSRLSSKMTCSFTLSLKQSLQVVQMISMMSHMLHAHTMATETSKQLKMASSFEVKLSPFLHQKERRSPKQYMKDTWESASAKIELDTVYIGPELNSDIKCLIESCPTCQHHHPQEPWQLLQPTPAPECPCHLLCTDYYHFDRSEYLVVRDYYSRMPIIKRIPASQCSASKTISVLKEFFAENGIPEVLHIDNGPQFSNALFTKFATDWKFDHNTSSPRNPRINGQAEAAVKTVKGLLTHAKCSGQDLYLAVLAYHSTPIYAHLCSPAEMPYQWVLCTNVP